MSEVQLDSVFGVSKNIVLSYAKRKDVDDKFEEALKNDKHIVVYGSSKQGKSALVQTHIKKENSITIGCSPTMRTTDIYRSLLRQSDVKLETSKTETKGTSSEVTGKHMIAIITGLFNSTSELAGKIGEASGETRSTQVIEFKLDIAQDITELLKAINFNKYIIIENFHYLDETAQEIFAYDLRTFQENGYKFIILGVWKEKNRLVQFNGDLQDRLIEVPVEPWKPHDFDIVIRKGCNELNITFSEEIINKIKINSFGSIGIVQELCKETCRAAGFSRRSIKFHEINDVRYFESAVPRKIHEYSSRHIRSLESIADCGSSTEGLYMPYYLVKVIIKSDLEDLMDGITRQNLHEAIKKVHYRGQDVRSSDMAYLLHGLSNIQNKKRINPPLFDYDRVNRRLRIIDSTLFFFFNFKKREEILEEIPDPTERYCS